MELYKKHRPKRLKHIFGNTTVINSIQSKAQKDNIPHALLFTGPKGTGKTTLGRIVASLVGCPPKTDNFDYIELDSGMFGGIDVVRNIRKQIRFKPLNNKCKVVLIDEIHMLGTGGSSMKNPAQNALLKLLESTPDHVYFILCTTDPQMLIAPLKSRCIPYELKTLKDSDMEVLLNKVIRKEKAEVPDDVIKQIILGSEGSPRNALQNLDKVIDMEEDSMLTAATEQKEVHEASIDLCRKLLTSNTWKEIQQLLKGLKNEDPERIRRHILQYMGTVLLGDKPKSHKRAQSVLLTFEDPLYSTGFPGLISFCYSCIVGDS